MLPQFAVRYIPTGLDYRDALAYAFARAFYSLKFDASLSSRNAPTPWRVVSKLPLRDSLGRFLPRDPDAALAYIECADDFETGSLFI